MLRRLVPLFGALLLASGCSDSGGDLPVGPFAEFIDAGSVGSGSGSASFSFIIGTSGSTAVVVTETSGTTVVATTTQATGTTVATTGTTVATTATSSTEMTGTTSSTVATTTASSTTHSTTATMSSTASGVTWTYLYDTYLASGSTIGDCDGSCHHHSQCSSPSSCYNWIGQGQKGALSNGGGLFTWDNGYMPTNGPSSDAQAESDFAAWIAAGSMNN